MQRLKPADEEILARYARALVHLRERRRAGRLALVLGAGVSLEFGFPDWNTLVARLCSTERLKDANAPGGVALTLRTQALLQHLIELHTAGDGPPTASEEREAHHEWIGLLHECLYRDVPQKAEDLTHSYIRSYLDVVRQAPLTVNYNFDDSIERLISHHYAQEQHDANDRLYETVWEPSTQFRRSSGVIYHPNGFLPQQLLEGFSESIVFSEGEFADQLIDTMSGHYATLMSHLSRYTTVLMGLSLSDSTLKHLLRQNTHHNPGHVHYYLKWCGALPSEEAARAEATAHFDVYGLVTIHLDSAGYEAFGRLLSCSDEEFHEMADKAGAEDRYVYYVSGPVGVGKTTVVQKLKSLAWLGEWAEQRHPLLAKPHTELSETERLKVDAWVSSQFRKKNFRLLELGRGVIVCDRSPLDPLVFTQDGEREERAAQHLTQLVPGSSRKQLEPGQVVFLTATPAELAARSRGRQRRGTPEYLADQQQRLEEIYGDGIGVTKISTSGRNVREVVRLVAKLIHLGDYARLDVHTRLSELAGVR